VDENLELTLPILRAKIIPPAPHRETTSRPALEARLSNAFPRKVTLVSAPAGYGKTTLLARALRQAPYPVAWLTLDKGDDHPPRFWRYLISALQTILPGTGASVLALLRSPQSPPFELVLVELLNDLANQGQEFILALDDLHEISSPEILENLAELIKNMPANMHLVLSSRQIPDLPLARLRARRELAELNATDLRFQSSEIEGLFNQLFGLDLSPNDLRTLENLTEGWIAGLQLAALVLRSAQPEAATLARLVESFRMGHPFVFDYLTQEVLDRQNPDLGAFMVQTGGFPRLCAALCDAALQRSDSQSMLERISAANLFLTPLDAGRRWYRYHPLFSSCLSRRLHAEQSPETIAQLVRRAAGWFDSQGWVHEAADLAESIPDHDLLAQIVGRSADRLFENSELVSITGWLRPLPLAIYEQNIRLGMIYAWALLATATAETVELVLQAVERGLDCAADGNPASFHQPAHIQAALAEICSLRASLAFNHFDLEAVLELSRRGREYLAGHSSESPFNKRVDLLSIAYFNEGLVLAFGGQVEAALAPLEESARLCEQAHNIHLLPMVYAQLSNVYLIQGRLRLAEETLRRAVPFPGSGSAHSPLAGVAYTRLGLIAYERNRLEEARELLQRGLEQGRRWNSWESAYLGHVGMARVHLALGEPGKARAEIDALEQVTIQPPTGSVAQTAAMVRAEIALRQGDLTQAQIWLADSGLSGESPLTLFNEDAMLLQARFLVASRQDREAVRLTLRMLQELEGQGRMGRALELLLLQAILYARQGAFAAMNQVLGRALEFAQAEGYQRSLLDLGADLLLTARDYSGPYQDYLQMLVDRLPTLLPGTSPGRDQARQFAPESPLSGREIEVLRLAADGKTNQEIADQLFISLNTVKTHLRHIFQRLEARNRAEAIGLARERHLI